MRAINVMTKRTDTEFFISRMEDIMKVSGRTTRCMASESFTMKMGR